MATDKEVLEKSICQINFDEDEEEVLPRYMYRYTLYWEHLYFALNGKQLIGRSGMYRNKLILQPKPLTLGDCKKLIARPGNLYCCKTSRCIGRFAPMRNNKDIVTLYKKKSDDNCIVIMYIFHQQ